MYGIFAYIWLIFVVNVGKYTLHGSYGIYNSHKISSSGAVNGDFCFPSPQKRQHTGTLSVWFSAFTTKLRSLACAKSRCNSMELWSTFVKRTTEVLGTKWGTFWFLYMMKTQQKNPLRFCEFRGFLYLWWLMAHDEWWWKYEWIFVKHTYVYKYNHDDGEYVMNHDAFCSVFEAGFHLKIIDENEQNQVKTLLFFSTSTLNVCL